MSQVELVYCKECGKLTEPNNSGVYACRCGWVGWTAERLATMTDSKRESDIKKYKKQKPFTEDGMMNSKKGIEEEKKPKKHGETREKILNFIKDSELMKLTPKEISDGMELSYANVFSHLKKLEAEGRLVKVFRAYALPSKDMIDPVPAAVETPASRALSKNMIISGAGGEEIFVDMDKISFVGMVCKDIDIGYRFDMVVDGIHVPVESKYPKDIERMRLIIISELKRFAGVVGGVG
jgi:hypothetical protein